jgi:hypothetical protein
MTLGNDLALLKSLGGKLDKYIEIRGQQKVPRVEGDLGNDVVIDTDRADVNSKNFWEQSFDFLGRMKFWLRIWGGL